MRTELTIKQSQRLIELGVNPYLASSKVIEKHFITENEIQYPIFTLADLLAILPKRVKKNDACLTIIADYTEWNVGYEYNSPISGISTVKSYNAPELIGALYDLVVWCIENKHLTTKDS